MYIYREKEELTANGEEVVVDGWRTVETEATESVYGSRILSGRE